MDCPQVLRHLRRLLNALQCVPILLASAVFGPTFAVNRAAPWDGLADTVFRHVPGGNTRFAESIAQDAQGFIWLGTQSGLTRWDGYRFRDYRANPRDSSALPDNYVLALHADERGRLWVGTGAGGLARYEPQTDSFVSVPIGPRGLSNASVSAIAGDGHGGLWLGTRAGLEHLDTDTGTVGSIKLDAQASGSVLAVQQDADGGLWLGGERGLWHRAPGSDQFSAVPLLAKAAGSLLVHVLRRDGAGRMWVGTRGHGAFVVESGGQNQPISVRAVHESGEASELETDTVVAITETGAGEVWLGTFGGGVVVVEPGAGGRTRRLKHESAVPASLQDDHVSTLFRDRSGLVWVGTAKALSQHDSAQVGISTLFGSAAGNKPIGSANVTFVMTASDGRVWLSLGDGGIDILDPVMGRVARLRPDAGHPLTALPKGRVLTMAQAADGEVWIGTVQGLYRADAAGRRVVRLAVPGRAVNLSSSALLLDEGVWWLGGPDGLWALEPAGAGAPRVLRRETAERLGNQPVTALLRGAGSALWVGTRAGLVRVDTATDAVEILPTDARDPTALLAGFTSSLLLDSRGRLWVASSGSGIQILDHRDAGGRARFHRIGTTEGLPDTGIGKLLLDAQGQVWASTDNGLAMIDPETYAVRSFGLPQGVTIRAYWSNAGGRAATGELLFGGEGGLTIVRPKKVRRAESRPAVVVTEARIGTRSVLASRLNLAGDNGAGIGLKLDATERSLMIEFAALDFIAPEQNQYSYRLKGLDTDWFVSEPSRRLATYTNLPPGTYTLQLRGSGPAAPWTPSVFELPITVLPAWYQTAAFHVTAVLLGVLSFGGLMQFRTSQLRRRQQELQGLVALRTVELERQAEALSESKKQLEELAYFDPLTGLANRRRFTEHAQWMIGLAARGAGSVTLLLIDLDRFKEINDTLGHDAGDAVLVAVAQRLRASVRQTDHVARLGGDEFAVLLSPSPDCDLDEVVCNRIVESLVEPIAFKQHVLKTSASIGMARCPDHAGEPDALYKCADLALYEAKHAGRNAWRWHLPVPVPAVPRVEGTPLPALNC